MTLRAFSPGARDALRQLNESNLDARAKIKRATPIREMGGVSRMEALEIASDIPCSTALMSEAMSNIAGQGKLRSTWLLRFSFAEDVQAGDIVEITYPEDEDVDVQTFQIQQVRPRHKNSTMLRCIAVVLS